MGAEEKTLWIDAGAGASGDMLLGALVDLGVPLGRLRAGLEGLGIEGWALSTRKVDRAGMRARRLRVRVRSDASGRTWTRVSRIVRAAGLSPAVRDRALAVFRRIFEAEAEIHGSTPERVHLHELGDDDALLDVVGSCIALEHLAPDRVVVSPMTTGRGHVRCVHGTYPVPAPVTSLLIRGAPVSGLDVEGERLTPTGAAILTTVADRWGALPAMIPSAIGQGAGERDFEGMPNVLRMILGSSLGGEGTVEVLELNVDEATPQAVAYAAERALAAGALDAFVVPALMKKGRSGHLLTVICRPTELDALSRLLLRETTTLGLRHRRERRIELDRSVVRVRTRWGHVRIKTAGSGEMRKAWPEYEDCASLARRHDVPLRTVQRAALDALRSRREPRD